RDRRRELRRFHYPRPGDALYPDGKHSERVLWHLYAEVCGHHLRNPLGPDISRRNFVRLRRRGGDEVGFVGAHYLSYSPRVRPVYDPASGVDGGVLGAHIHYLQPLWVHHRRVG